MKEKKAVVRPIENAQLVNRYDRLCKIRDFFHDLVPGLVNASNPITELHTSAGKVYRIDKIYTSAEGIRYGGSATPVPTDEI